MIYSLQTIVFFIFNTFINKEGELEEEKYKKNKKDELLQELYGIKGYFHNKNDIVGYADRKEEVNSFIYSLLALFINKH